MMALDENTAAPQAAMMCDDCHVLPALVKYPGDTVTYYFCLGCAGARVEALRRRMAHLTKAIRKVKEGVPAAWQEFLKERQTT